jgi:Predicted membrane protein (DUF2142)
LSDDPAILKPDEPAVEPAVEPAAATSEPASVTHEPGNQGRIRGVLPALAGWLLVVIAAFGLLASTPPSAGPDEAVQQATAWYLSGHVLQPDGAPEFTVPAQLLVGLLDGPCYAHDQSQSAGCMPPRSREMVSFPYAKVLNYAPPYYWVVGAGERLAALLGLEYADVGGRLASFILSFGTLLLLTLYMRRRNPLWGSFLLLVSTPTAVWFGIVVNPSGWEITCGIAMAAILAEAAWGRLSSIESEAWPKSTIAMLALASIGLTTARPLGFLWAAGLTVSAIALAPSIHRRGLLRIVCAVAPGIAVGILWYVTHPYVVAAPSTFPGLMKGFIDTFMFFPEYIRHMFGVLGWLDEPIPGLLLILNIAAWAVLLTRLPSIRKSAIVCGIGGIVVVPCAISASLWAAWPLWWQGRYGMPFACGFMLLLLLRSGRLIPRTISAVSGISLLTLGIMVWVNEIRYGFGMDGLGLPVSLGTPGISPVRLGISAVLGALLVLVSGYLLVRAWRSKPDFVLGNEPEQLLIPSESDVD